MMADDLTIKAQIQSSTEFRQKKPRLGEALVEQGLIDEDQLQEALKRQSQVGGHLGSILIDLGYITLDDLIEALGKSIGVPGVNLFNKDISEETLKSIPKENIIKLNILPTGVDDHTITLAMVNPHDQDIIAALEFQLGKKIRPVVVPHFMMKTAIKGMELMTDSVLRGSLLAKIADEDRERVTKAPKLLTLLKYLIDSHASDMLLTVGVPPSIRVSSEVNRLAMGPLSPGDCERYAKALMPKNDWELFMQKNDHEFAVTLPNVGRFRATVYRQRSSISMTVRSLPDILPSLKELNLPEWIKDYILKPQGLILISGPAGHGKSTTLCAMVDFINENRRCNIVTLEDPVEFLYKHKKSNVNQREVGRDTESFYEGLKNATRQATDVIVVGEMRDTESFEIALRAADTGHLVLSTVNSENSTSNIERILNMFEPSRQNQLRIMLADSLLFSLSQRLVPRKDGNGRILALEKLINSRRTRKMILEEKTRQIRSQMQVGTEEFTSLDTAMATLCNQNLINFEDGLIYVEDEAFYRNLTKNPL
jgi:twitching motility protein PilT